MDVIKQMDVIKRILVALGLAVIWTFLIMAFLFLVHAMKDNGLAWLYYIGVFGWCGWFLWRAAGKLIR